MPYRFDQSYHLMQNRSCLYFKLIITHSYDPEEATWKNVNMCINKCKYMYCKQNLKLNIFVFGRRITKVIVEVSCSYQMQRPCQAKVMP